MTKTEVQRLALALLKARPPVIPGSNVIVDERARKTWYDCVTAVAEVCEFPNTKAGKLAAHTFFNVAGVPE